MSNQNVESLDVSAKTVDEAIEQGLAQLGLTRDQVDIEIIREGKRGVVFGLGAEEAQVRLTPRIEVTSVSSADDNGFQTASVSDFSDQLSELMLDDYDDSGEASSFEETEASAEALPSPSPPERKSKKQKKVEDIAKEHLENILEFMGIQAQVTARINPELVESGERPPLVLNISGDDLGILIGRRSETLWALQYMLRLMVSKEMASWQPVVVDVESYRVRRRRSLRKMAETMAERVVASRQRVVLEAMPAYERRIIHIALKNHPGVITKSIGADDNRKVTIIPK